MVIRVEMAWPSSTRGTSKRLSLLAQLRAWEAGTHWKLSGTVSTQAICSAPQSVPVSQVADGDRSTPPAAARHWTSSSQGRLSALAMHAPSQEQPEASQKQAPRQPSSFWVASTRSSTRSPVHPLSRHGG